MSRNVPSHPPVKLRCLFCRAWLRANERKEHPILDSLGGRLKSRNLICNDCNQRLGAVIDGPLATAFETVRHVLRIRSGEGAAPPTLRGVASEHGIVDLGPAHGAVSEISPHTIGATSDTRTDFQVQGRTTEETARNTAHLARRLKIKTRDELVRRIQLPANMHIQKRPFTQPVQLTMPLGAPEHMRSIAKSALEIFALVAPRVARGPALKHIRQFIATGAGSDDDVRWLFTPPPTLPFTREETGDFAPPPLRAGVGARRRRLVAHVMFFGHLQFLVRLADTWDGQVAIAHAVDPVGERLLRIREQFEPPPAVNVSVFEPEILDLDKVEKYLTEFFQKCAAIQEERHRHWLLRDALAPWFAKYAGTDMTPEKAHEAASVVAAEVVAARFGANEPIDPEKFLERVVYWFDELALKDGR